MDGDHDSYDLQCGLRVTHWMRSLRRGIQASCVSTPLSCPSVCALDFALSQKIHVTITSDRRGYHIYSLARSDLLQAKIIIPQDLHVILDHPAAALKCRGSMRVDLELEFLTVNLL